MGCDRFRYRTLRLEPNAFWNILVVLVEDGHTSAGVAVRISAITEATVIKRVAELAATMLTDSLVHSPVTQRFGSDAAEQCEGTKERSSFAVVL
jgi:hypothetical protein